MHSLEQASIFTDPQIAITIIAALAAIIAVLYIWSGWFIHLAWRLIKLTAFFAVVLLIVWFVLKHN